jgi:hypothetical protein
MIDVDEEGSLDLFIDIDPFSVTLMHRGKVVANARVKLRVKFDVSCYSGLPRLCCNTAKSQQTIVENSTIPCSVRRLPPRSSVVILVGGVKWYQSWFFI